MEFTQNQIEPTPVIQTSGASSTNKLATKRQKIVDKPSPTAAAAATATTTSNEKSSDRLEREDNGQTIDPSCCKENQNKEKYERYCFACERSLAKSRHLINIAGQLHRWHPECFKCQVCNYQLDKETSCHIYKEKIVCKHDYAKLQRDNTTKCARCHWPIGALDWVRRAGEFVYHLACFTCDICSRQLSTGEQFTLNIQENAIVRLLCRLHFAIQNQHDEPTYSTIPSDKLVSSQQQASKQAQNLPSRISSAASSSFQSSFNHYDRNISKTPSSSSYHPHQQTPFPHSSASASYLHMLVASSSSDEKQDHHQVASDYNELMSNSGTIIEGQQQQHHHHYQDHQQEQRARTSTSTSSSNGSTNSNNLMGLAPKSKRVRTTFTEDQLSILQTHFQIDSNPDGQDLERIATITGLSKRVTQVWFQNSRARQKKYLIKRKPSSASSSSAVTTSTINNNTIGLPRNPSPSSPGGIQNSFFQHQTHHHHQQQHQRQQQSLHSSSRSNEPTKVDCINNHQYQQQHRDGASVSELSEQAKWSNISDQSNSDLSLDDTTKVVEDDEVEEDETRSRSSDDQLEVSDFDSNEQDH